MKRSISTFLIALAVSGCASNTNPVAIPNFIGGQYFMAGDNACLSARVVSDGRLECFDGANNATGYREAMTDQQLQMWQHNQQMAQMRAAQARAERAALINQMERTAASIQQSTPQYAPPPTPYVAPINMPGNNVISCISVSDGFYTNCRY